MSYPSQTFEVIRRRMDELAAAEGRPLSEREAARRCGLNSSSGWNYYLKRDREDVIPLWVLECVAEGLAMSTDQTEQLLTAALRDAGWRVRAVIDRDSAGGSAGARARAGRTER